MTTIFGSGRSARRSCAATRGMQLLQLAGHDGTVISVAWSPDGGRLASGGSGRECAELFVWEAHSGTPVHAFEGHPSVVSALSWVSNGELVVSGGSDGRLRWWDLQSAGELGVRASARGPLGNGAFAQAKSRWKYAGQLRG